MTTFKGTHYAFKNEPVFQCFEFVGYECVVCGGIHRKAYTGYGVTTIIQAVRGGLKFVPTAGMPEVGCQSLETKRL